MAFTSQNTLLRSGFLSVAALTAVSFTLTAGAAGAPSHGRAPTLAEVEKIWGGGTWVPDRFNMGSWMSGFKNVQEYVDPDFVPPNPVPLNAEAMKVYRNIRSEMGKGHQIFGPYAQCHPPGMPYRLSLGYFEAVVSRKEIVFVYGDLNYRRIYMDGRAHPSPDVTPSTYYGHSVGHWEGRTLVIDTTNIRGDNTQIEPHIPKAEGSRVVERYTPIDATTMDAEFSMTNPEFTKPWVVKFRILKDPRGSLIEALCSDGNRYRIEDGELTMFNPDGTPLQKAEE